MNTDSMATLCSCVAPLAMKVWWKLLEGISAVCSGNSDAPFLHQREEIEAQAGSSDWRRIMKEVGGRSRCRTDCFSPESASRPQSAASCTIAPQRSLGSNLIDGLQVGGECLCLQMNPSFARTGPVAMATGTEGVLHSNNRKGRTPRRSRAD